MSLFPYVPMCLAPHSCHRRASLASPQETDWEENAGNATLPFQNIHRRDGESGELRREGVIDLPRLNGIRRVGIHVSRFFLCAFVILMRLGVKFLKFK